jgi:hypothetical protein
MLIIDVLLTLKSVKEISKIFLLSPLDAVVFLDSN